MKTAVFGGTFDPVHTGHIQMARIALEQFSLQKLILVPNANPPHKRDVATTDYVHRYNMLDIAFKGMESVVLSDYESRGDMYYYSLYTMRHFRELYGDDTAMIIGGDSLLSLDSWHCGDLFVKENSLIVFTRGNDTKVEQAIESLRQEGARIYKAHMPPVDISSTDIRLSLERGIVPEGALTDEVADYIRQNRLYGGSI